MRILRLIGRFMIRFLSPKRFQRETGLVLLPREDSRTPAGDLRRVACNFARSRKAVKNGGLAYVCIDRSYDQRLYLLVRSRSGRWIQKWENLRNLRDFRLKTIPQESPLFVRLEGYSGGPQQLSYVLGHYAELVQRGETPSGAGEATP